MSSIERLIQVARAVTPTAEVRFEPVEERQDWSVCTIWIGNIFIVRSAPGPVDQIITDALESLEKLSERVHDAGQEP